MILPVTPQSVSPEWPAFKVVTLISIARYAEKEGYQHCHQSSQSWYPIVHPMMNFGLALGLYKRITKPKNNMHHIATYTPQMWWLHCLYFFFFLARNIFSKYTSCLLILLEMLHHCHFLSEEYVLF